MVLSGVGTRRDDGELAAAVAAFQPLSEVAERRGDIEHLDNLQSSIVANLRQLAKYRRGMRPCLSAGAKRQ